MSSEIHSIWTHGRVYLLGNVVNRIAGLLLIPVYAKLLAPDEFGVYALIVVAMDLLEGALGLGVGGALARVYVEHSDQMRRNMVISSTLLAYSALGIIVVAASWPLSQVLGQVLFSDPAYRSQIYLALAGLVFSTLFTVQLECFRVRKQSRAFLIACLVKSSALLAASLVFVVFLRYGVTGIFIASLLTFSLLSLTLLAVLFRETGIGFSSPALWAVLGLGMPLVPARLFDAATRFVVGYLLKLLMSSAQLGYYGLGVRLAQLMNMLIIQPFSQIFVVRRFETAGDRVLQAQLSTVFVQFLALLAWVGLGLSVMAPEIVHVVATPEYLPAVAVVPFLAIASGLHAIWSVHFEVDVLEVRRSGVIPLVSGACLVIGFPLTWALISTAGLVGAGIAMAFVQAVRVVLMRIASGRLNPARAPLQFGRIGGVFLLGTVFYLFSVTAFGFEVTPATFLMKLSLLVAFPVLVFFSPIIGPSGRRSLISYLRDQSRRSSPGGKE